jgi:hypothetical protein
VTGEEDGDEIVFEEVYSDQNRRQAGGLYGSLRKMGR